jgi:hypothetical protein
LGRFPGRKESVLMCARFRFIAFILGVVLAAPSVVAAQATTGTRPGGMLNVSVKAGLNVSTLTGDGVSGPKRLMGATGGLSVSRDFSKRIGLQVEGLYAQRGAKFSSSDGTGQFRATYFDIPVLLRVGGDSPFLTHIYGFAGPTFGLRMEASLTANGEKHPNFSAADIEGVDMGWTLGVGVEGSRFMMDARYTLGSTNVEKRGGNIKHASFTVMAGVRVW